MRLGDAVRVDEQEVPGRHLMHVAIDRVRRGDVAVQEEGGQRLRVDLGLHGGMLEQRLDLRPECEDAGPRRVVQRLLAHAVAGEQQAPSRPVPDREREHPVQPIEAGFAVLRVEVNDDLGVRGASEVDAARDELGAELAVVVDLAVERDPDRAVRAHHRLRGGFREIDDAKPRVAEAHADRSGPDDSGALLLRAAMRERRRHPLERLDIGPPPAEHHESRDSAHRLDPHSIGGKLRTYSARHTRQSRMTFSVRASSFALTSCSLAGRTAK